MIDPASIGLAIAGVKTAAELVKKGIDAAKDVNEVTKDLGKLFDHTETLSKAKKEVGKGKKGQSLSQQAMNIVTAERNAKQALADIKQKLLWGPYPDGGQFWKDFLRTRQQMIREQKQEEAREKAALEKKKTILTYVVDLGGVFSFCAYTLYKFFLWLINYHK